MKQIIALSLAVLAVCGLLVACGGDSSSDDATEPQRAAIVLPTDAEGAPVYATDAEGWPVYPTDAQGDVVFATDAQGETIVAHDADGNAITGNGGATEGTKPASTAAPTAAPGTAADSTEPAEGATEGEIPVIIATLPEGEGYELPILP